MWPSKKHVAFIAGTQSHLYGEHEFNAGGELLVVVFEGSISRHPEVTALVKACTKHLQTDDEPKFRIIIVVRNNKPRDAKALHSLTRNASDFYAFRMRYADEDRWQEKKLTTASGVLEYTDSIVEYNAYPIHHYFENQDLTNALDRSKFKMT